LLKWEGVGEMGKLRAELRGESDLMLLGART
jgi:hypothetical protein